MNADTLVALVTALALQANPTVDAIPSAVPPVVSAPGSTLFVESIQPPEKRRKNSFGIVTSAKSAIVVDVASGAVLYTKGAEIPRSIASLTKMMTAMVALDVGLRPDEVVTFEAGDFDREARATFAVGESLTRRDALRAVLVGSVNEAANALARTAMEGGTEAFVQAMRNKGDVLGLRHTTYVDPSGISSRNRASAVDIATVLRSALAYPEIRVLTADGAYDQLVGKRVVRIKPTNLLLSSYLHQKPYQISVAKTGSLPEAGFCLAQVTRHPAGQQVISVVLGSENHFARFQEVKALTAWAFDSYEWK
jgi:serine-type D-Ala-D-Ala endopeptidase (penicillin-binding protein 7)